MGRCWNPLRTVSLVFNGLLASWGKRVSCYVKSRYVLTRWSQTKVAHLVNTWMRRSRSRTSSALRLWMSALRRRLSPLTYADRSSCTLRDSGPFLQQRQQEVRFLLRLIGFFEFIIYKQKNIFYLSIKMEKETGFVNQSWDRQRVLYNIPGIAPPCSLCAVQ